jgi:hypothetical protein
MYFVFYLLIDVNELCFVDNLVWGSEHKQMHEPSFKRFADDKTERILHLVTIWLF